MTSWLFCRALSFAALSAVLGCSTGGPVGVEDVDAGAIGDDAGSEPDAGPCPQRCGTTEPVCCLESCEMNECLPVCDGFRCGDECCGAGTVCVDGSCEAPRAECIDTTDCGAGEYCDLLLGRCLPVPSGGETCEYRPPPEVFEPELLWAYDEESVMSAPIVIQLTDDDDDGRIDGRDVPDVVVQAFPGHGGVFEVEDARLVALSGDDGRVLWRSDPDWDVCALGQAAAGDLDGDGTVEIVTTAVPAGTGCAGLGPTEGTRLATFSHEGHLEWLGDTTTSPWFDAGIAIADVDGDGHAEIWANGALFEHDGTLRWEDEDGFAIYGAAIGFAADVGGEPGLELINGRGVWSADGTRLWLVEPRDGELMASTALADILPDAGPELILVNGETVRLLDPLTGEDRTTPIVIGDSPTLPGSPAVGDFDADGRPEIGVAVRDSYVVLDPDLPAPHVLWEHPSMDSTTGSVSTTLFDFDGDGRVEVLLTDECHLRVLSGEDGRVLWSAPNNSVTIMEYAVVADVNRDGHANIIAPSYITPEHYDMPSSKCSARGLPFDRTVRGVRVYRDRLNNWIEARGVWNQHAYHYDNVRPDGSIPANPRRGWETHNTFRVNRYPNAETVFLAPNLRVAALHTDAVACPTELVVRARVENAGSRSVAGGVPVTFYARRGTPPDAVLGTARTSSLLPPGAAEWVELAVSDVGLDADRSLSFYAIADDDGSGSGGVNECIEDDNGAPPLFVDCSGPF